AEIASIPRHGIRHGSPLTWSSRSVAAAMTVACPDCDLLQRLPELSPGSKARCARCGSTLVTRPIDPIDRRLALVVAAAIVFIVAHTAPLMALGGRALLGHDRRRASLPAARCPGPDRCPDPAPQRE